ncbi:MAG: hypothetical protein K2X32_01910 [Phycisphaerales bacterium]|nr:hypothetical protein [Phycisphaerales bacterium]
MAPSTPSSSKTETASPDTPIIDLRSDTVTRPTPAMRAAMMSAALGDDVLGDDPTVRELEARVCQIMGKEAACFVPTGTMANQVAIRAHTEPGDELIAHEDSHIIHYETGAPAALSGVMIRVVRGEMGMFDEAAVRRSVRHLSDHDPRSRLLVIENTHNRAGGVVWPVDRFRAVTAAARERGLSVHMDGARIWNACAASGVPASEYAACVDSLSCCFSKGLGAPVGSAVAGSAPFIARVRRFRKMFGGGMRQSGVLAAAAIYALDHHRERLTQDHANAAALGAALANVRGLSIASAIQTNMVFVNLSHSLPGAGDFCRRLRERGVLALDSSDSQIRLVTHLDVSRAQCEHAADVIAAVATSLQS